MRIGEICRLTGRSIRTVDRWIKDGQFPAPEFKVGHLREWTRGAVLDWLQRSGRVNKAA